MSTNETIADKNRAHWNNFAENYETSDPAGIKVSLCSCVHTLAQSRGPNILTGSGFAKDCRGCRRRHAEEIPFRGEFNYHARLCVRDGYARRVNIFTGLVLTPAFVIGIVSRRLAPYCLSITGADISENMIELYNKFAQDTPDKDKMEGYAFDLLSPAQSSEDKSLKGMLFDVIVVSDRRPDSCIKPTDIAFHWP